MIERNSPNSFADIQIPVPWGHISGRWYGDQMTRPLVALHGWHDNCGSFSKLAPLLVRTAGSILCIDFPGHGRSSHIPPGIQYNTFDYVTCVARLMKVYNWSKISLLGHSMGGAVAFYFAALTPRKVDLLIALDCIKYRYFEPHFSIEVSRFVNIKVLDSNERLVATGTLQEPPSYTFAECEQLLHKGTEGSLNLENCKYILERNLSKSKMYPNRYYFSRDPRIKYLMDLNVEEELGRAMLMGICNAQIPYMVIKGGNSEFMSPDSMALTELLKEHNPNFEMHSLAGATHHMHLNDESEVANLILPFLRHYRPLAQAQAESAEIQADRLKGKL